MTRTYTESEVAAMSPGEFRSIVRRGEWTTDSRSACKKAYALFNLVALPREYAIEFSLFGLRNPRGFYATDVTEPGNPHPKLLAPDADLRTDYPKYRVYKNGELVDEPTDVIKYWRDDMVAFMIGSIANLRLPLENANVQFRFRQGYTRGFTSNIPTVAAGRFHSPLRVVCFVFKSMGDAIRGIQISSRYIATSHGLPIHVGDPSAIGLEDFNLEPGEVPVFWGTGVAKRIAEESKISLMISHVPTHMFVSDRLIEELAVV